MMQGSGNGWLIFAISFVCAALSALGMGGGGLLLVYLTAYAGLDQRVAQGVNLAFFIPVSLVAITLHAKKHLIQWKTALPCILLGAPGVYAGWRLALALEEAWLTKAFALLLALVGARELFGGAADGEQEQK